MLIEIPDDLARKAKRTIDHTGSPDWRGLAEDAERTNDPFLAVEYLLCATLVEADLPEPIQVGHLARWNDDEDDNEPSLVLAIDGPEAWIRRLSGRRTNAAIDRLTYAGPKPEGWGE